jgi:hypothetical protein
MPGLEAPIETGDKVALECGSTLWFSGIPYVCVSLLLNTSSILVRRAM